MAGKKKLIGYVLLILVIIVFTFGYYLWNKPSVDVAGADGLKTDAAALYNTFATDSLLAKKKYSQQIIQVTGKVNGISTNQQNQTVILLGTAMEGGNINCTMEGVAGNIKTSDSIIIKGICNGLGQGDADLGILGDVYMIRCYQVK